MPNLVRLELDTGRYEKLGGIFEFVDNNIYFGVIFEIFQDMNMKIQVMYPNGRDSQLQAKTISKHMSDLFLDSYNS